MSINKDIERFENELSLYEKEVDCNEKFYKLAHYKDKTTGFFNLV